MRISLVIPALDESESIQECLAAIAAQTRPFDEVILVDNGSTDGTAEVARAAAGALPLTVVAEPRAGVRWARDRGYEVATGDVVARIDADTRLDPGWAQAVEDYFGSPGAADAATGINFVYDGHSSKEDLVRQMGAEREPWLGGELHGANMAVRADAYRRAREFLVNRPDVHEDIDLSYALVKAGSSIAVVPKMAVGTSARRLRASVGSNAKYVWATVRSRWVHGDRGRAAKEAAITPLAVAALAVQRLTYVVYDRRNGRGGPARRTPLG